MSSEQIAESAAHYFGLPVLDLSEYDKNYLPRDLIRTPLLENELIQNKLALPIYQLNNYVELAISDPTLPGLNELNFLTGFNIHLILVEADKLAQLAEAILHDELANEFDGFGDTEQAPVVRFINKVLIDAVNKRASDIHFEPYEDVYRIRYRQDGILVEMLTPPLEMSSYLIARLKVMANLDISEKRLPQDGRFTINLIKDRPIDFRVSSCPTAWGEKIVLRILESSRELLNLNSLGMEPTQKEFFLQALQRSQGMILVTGPTGSGKTVTLYTALDILNTSGINISSIEDPIEIHLSGINQVQVNPKIGLDFSCALRTFLRQDPDLIMVGEIRDQETAEIAIKAAQTGHLVFSTLHTNSAAQTLVRLAQMGIASYHIANSIKLIVAQRLVRCLCSHCKKRINVPKSTLMAEGFNEKNIAEVQLYGPVGCPHCYQGYKGRIGIYEVMPISEKMEGLIMTHVDVQTIVEQAQVENIMSLRQAGLAKVKQGITSLEEVNRVC